MNLAKLRSGQWVKADGRALMYVSRHPCLSGGYIYRFLGKHSHNCGWFLRLVWEFPGGSKLMARSPWYIKRGGRREDGHEFHMAVSPNARDFVIQAGCRVFHSFHTARRHWSSRWRCGWDGDLLDNPLNVWSLEVVDIFERTLKDLRSKARKQRAKNRAED